MNDATAQANLDDAWRALIQAKADADQAIAQKRWSDALNHTQKIRWAASDLEYALDCKAAATTKP